MRPCLRLSFAADRAKAQLVLFSDGFVHKSDISYTAIDSVAVVCYINANRKKSEVFYSEQDINYR